MAERTGREGFADAQRFQMRTLSARASRSVDIGWSSSPCSCTAARSLRAGDHLLQRRIAEDADVLQRAAITALARASFTARGEVGTNQPT